jgi:hypothetical protein
VVQRIGRIAMDLVPVLLTAAIVGFEMLGHRWR